MIVGGAAVVAGAIAGLAAVLAAGPGPDDTLAVRQATAAAALSEALARQAWQDDRLARLDREIVALGARVRTMPAAGDLARLLDAAIVADDPDRMRVPVAGAVAVVERDLAALPLTAETLALHGDARELIRLATEPGVLTLARERRNQADAVAIAENRHHQREAATNRGPFTWLERMARLNALGRLVVLGGGAVAGGTVAWRLTRRQRDGVATSPKVVLLVEDEPMTRAVARALLERHGLAVIEADSAAGAKAKIKAMIGAGRVRAAIVDLHLPDGDGVDLIATFCRAPGMAGVPIVAMTATGEAEVVAAAQAAGAVAVVGKPLIWAVVAPLIDAGGAGPAPSRRNDGPFDEAPIADMRTMLPSDRVESLLATALSRFDEAREEIDLASARGDRAQLSASAHRLAGTAALFGCVGLRQAAQALERAADHGAPDVEQPLRTVLGAIAPARRFITDHRTSPFTLDDRATRR